MWYPWIALLVSCALVVAEVTDGPVATTRAPPRTLDRQPGELAWRQWFQNPDDGNQNAPPRRITTKSLFITPIVCPKGHRLDGAACVELLTVNKDEHERILLHQLNSLFPHSPNNGDVVYDYGDEDPGPLQLSIPIGMDPQQDPSAQAQDQQPNYVKFDKNGEKNKADIEAELELLKLQANAKHNSTQNGSNIMSHNVLHNLLTYSDKPKRDSPMINSSEIELVNSTDEGQKELVFGHVNVDPVLYDTDDHNSEGINGDYEAEKTNEPHLGEQNNALNKNSTETVSLNSTSIETAAITKKKTEDAKLNPENDYVDIGEAIKLISRYAAVSTDDNFSKDDKKVPSTEDSILGTRTKLQYRRNKPKPSNRLNESVNPNSEVVRQKDDIINDKVQQKNILYYRYPLPSERAGSQPPNYPFRHLQDYWPGRSQVGGVYNTMHGNPRRHHHSYPHYFRPRGYQNLGYSDTNPGLQEAYYGLQRYPHKNDRYNTSPIRSHVNDQDLYSLLGLRHWFSSEGATKR